MTENDFNKSILITYDIYVIGDFFMNQEYTITEDILFTNFIRSKPNISEKSKTH